MSETDISPRTRMGYTGWFMILMAVVGAVVLLFLVWNWRLSSLLERELDATRAAGYPATVEELEQYYPQPEGPNAADVYRRAFALRVEDQALEDRMREWGLAAGVDAADDHWPDDLRADIEAHLERNAAAIELLHEGANIEESRWPTDWLAGVTTARYPHLPELRRSAQLLRLQSIAQADRGDTAGAVATVEAIAGLARSLRTEPILISQLVRISIEALARANVQSLVKRATFSPAELQRLSAALEPSMDVEPMVVGMAGERAAGLKMMDEEFEQRGGPIQGLRVVSGVRNLDALAYLRMMERLVEAANTPFVPLPDFEATVMDLPWYTYGSRMALPALDSVLRTQQRLMTSVQVLLVGLAVEQYRLEHGNWPADLAALTPGYVEAALLTDPFREAALQYVVEDEVVKIYSVGADGYDDGGRPRNADGSEFAPGSDIAFELPRR